MLSSTRPQIDVGAPDLAQGVSSRAHHARQGLQAIEFAERDFRQGRLDRYAQALVINRTREAARKACRELLERHDLKAMALLSRGSEP
jgi:hypothetical protein